MKSPHTSTFSSLLVAGLLLLAACDSAFREDAPDALSAADVALVSEIAAQSVADASEGTMSDLNDLNAGVSAAGLGYGDGPFAHLRNSPAGRLWRGSNRYQRAVYDSTTGEHTIQYERSIKSPFYDKQLSVHLVYVFTDAAGAFIARPLAQAGRIDGVAFTGERTGHARLSRLNGDSREVRFGREAAWKATSVQSGTITFEGTQHDAGTFTLARGDTTAERAYEGRFQTENVVIGRGDRDDLEGAVSGQIRYTITLKKSRNGTGTEKTVEGTIELEGNGKALLRVMGVSRLHRIDLKTGEVAPADG